MASRRDQLQSYQFLLQRVVSALVYRKTDPAQSPFRRTGGAVFAGVMLAALALAITAAISLFASDFGKDRDWVMGNKVIIDEDNSTPYVVLPPSKDGKHQPKHQVLYPVTNFASAALLAGTTETITVSAKSLAGEDENLGDTKIPPRGTPIGIVGAPESLPKGDQLLDDPWTLCSKPPSGSGSPSSKLFIGKMSGVSDTKLGEGKALLVDDGDDVYMLVDGRLHRIGTDVLDAARTQLAWDKDITRKVDPAFTSGIEQGDPVTFPDLGGEPGDPAGDNGKIGTVYKNSAPGGTVYLAQTKDGFARVTEFQAEILKAAVQQGDYETGSANQDDDQRTGTGTNAVPRKMPRFQAISDLGAQTCATYSKSGKVTIAHDVTFKKEIPGVRTSGHDDAGAKFVNRIAMKPGTGALVQTGPKELSLVTDDGAIFVLDPTKPTKTKGSKFTPEKSAMEALGYTGNLPKVHLPGNVIHLIPRGPELSPQRAMDAVSKE